MSTVTPTIEFFSGLSEELSNVSLRRNAQTGVRNAVFTFRQLRALEKFQSFTKEFNGELRLIDEEGQMSIEPTGVKFIFGGDDGDELKGAECGFDLAEDAHWERFMRFMKRYAAANGMDYQDR